MKKPVRYSRNNGALHIGYGDYKLTIFTREKARFSVLSKMSKVSLKDYIIMDGKQISTLALDQISVLDDEAWKEEGL